MQEKIVIRIVVDPSLVQYFAEGMSKDHLDCSVTDELSEFLAAVLNDSMYPIASKKTGEDEVHLDYRPKAYADPIF